MNTYEFDVYDDAGYWGSIRGEGESIEEARNDCKSHLCQNELAPKGTLMHPFSLPSKNLCGEIQVISKSHRPKPVPSNFPKYQTFRIDKAMVLLTNFTDKVFLTTDFPCPYVKEFMPKQEPLVLSFDTTHGKGVEYVRENFLVEPEVVELK